MSKRLTIAILALLLASLACNAVFPQGTPTEPPPMITEVTEGPSPIPSDGETPTAPATDDIIPNPPTETSQPLEPVDVQEICPSPGDGTELYISEENGYCFLFPDSYELMDAEHSPPDEVSLVGPHLTPPPGVQETAGILMFVSLNGEDEGMDSVQYATRYQEIHRVGGSSPETSTFGEEPAAVIRNLPGMIEGQMAFVVANGYRYSISLYPEIGAIPELDAPAQQGWNTISDTIVFFPPQGRGDFLRAEDVCPMPGSSTKVFISRVDGYCLLYPADFEADPEFPGRFVGGPVVGTHPDFGEVRTSLTMGTFGYFPNQTPRQIIEPRMDQLEEGSVIDAVIGGKPAVVYHDAVGPWRSRYAIIVYDDGGAYTIVAQPEDSELYPSGIPYVESVWETVTNSLAFFNRWK